MTDRTPSLGSILNSAKHAVTPYGPDIDIELRKLAKCYVRLLRDYRSACDRGDRGQIRSRKWHIERTMAARICSVVLAWATGNKNERRRKMSWDEVKRRARDLNLRRPSDAPIHVVEALKPAGGTRQLVDYHIDHRARQKLILDVLEIEMGQSRYEYARKGRGRDAAVRAALHACKHGGVKWFVELDVKDFFGSFRRDGVIKMLPLPRSIITNSILSPSLPTLSTLSNKVVLAAITQGSLANPFIAAKLLEPILDQLDCPLVLAHVDNILLGCRTKDEADANVDALASLLERHPAGPLSLKHANIFDLNGVSDFLGYWFRRQAPKFGGFARVTPSKLSIARAQRKLWRD